MKRYILFFILLSCFVTDALAQKYFSIYVENMSDFNIVCEGMPKKGGGVFTKYTSTLGKHKYFVFEIESNKGTLPMGVEGTLRFRLSDPDYPGYAECYFDNPAVGSPEFSMNTIQFPFAAQQITIADVTNPIAAMIEKSVFFRLYVDTAKNSKPVNLLTTTPDSKPKPNNGSNGADVSEPIPDIINFEWEVRQRRIKDDDDDDDDNKGKAYHETTYYFTGNGGYAAIKPDDASFDLMIYTPKGLTWMVNEAKKKIIVMSMVRTVGEGAVMGKAVAESIKKSPLEKDRDEELSITKTGKTKKIFSYTADEYVMSDKSVKTTKNMGAGISFWYVTVPFDPVRVYTMGVGRPADLSKLQNDPRMKNNMAAIPVLNKNYLMGEMEAGGRKAMETLAIEHRNFTFRTAGYTIKVAKSIKDMVGE